MSRVTCALVYLILMQLGYDVSDNHSSEQVKRLWICWLAKVSTHLQFHFHLDLRSTSAL